MKWKLDYQDYQGAQKVDAKHILNDPQYPKHEGAMVAQNTQVMQGVLVSSVGSYVEIPREAELFQQPQPSYRVADKGLFELYERNIVIYYMPRTW